MDEREKQQIGYPEKNRQYHSYGVRYWNGDRWLYWGSKYSKKNGHVEQWLDTDSKCWTTTGLLDAMFLAQGLALKHKVVIEVIRFEEPTVEWITCHSHQSLELEDINKTKLRNKKCKCDSNKQETCDVCSGWTNKLKDKEK